MSITCQVTTLLDKECLTLQILMISVVNCDCTEDTEDIRLYIEFPMYPMLLTVIVHPHVH